MGSRPDAATERRAVSTRPWGGANCLRAAREAERPEREAAGEVRSGPNSARPAARAARGIVLVLILVLAIVLLGETPREIDGAAGEPDEENENDYEYENEGRPSGVWEKEPPTDDTKGRRRPNGRKRRRRFFRTVGWGFTPRHRLGGTENHG